MSEHALRPCPFCAHPVSRHNVFRATCGCLNPDCFLYNTYFLIEAWNTRPLEQELLAACKAVASTPSDGQFVLVTRETLLCVLDAIAHAEAAEGRAG